MNNNVEFFAGWNALKNAGQGIASGYKRGTGNVFEKSWRGLKGGYHNITSAANNFYRPINRKTGKRSNNPFINPNTGKKRWGNIAGATALTAYGVNKLIPRKTNFVTNNYNLNLDLADFKYKNFAEFARRMDKEGYRYNPSSGVPVVEKMPSDIKDHITKNEKLIKGLRSNLDSVNDPLPTQAAMRNLRLDNRYIAKGSFPTPSRVSYGQKESKSRSYATGKPVNPRKGYFAKRQAILNKRTVRLQQEETAKRLAEKKAIKSKGVARRRQNYLESKAKMDEFKRNAQQITENAISLPSTISKPVQTPSASIPSKPITTPLTTVNTTIQNISANKPSGKAGLIGAGIVGGLGLIGGGAYLYNRNRRQYNKKNLNYWTNK